MLEFLYWTMLIFSPENFFIMNETDFYSRYSQSDAGLELLGWFYISR